MSFTYQQSSSNPTTYKVQTKYGEFELRVLGDPARLLDIPIKFYYGVDVKPKVALPPLYQPVEKSTS